MYVQYLDIILHVTFIFSHLLMLLMCNFVGVLDSNSLILKKGDVETVFKIFQDTDENKKLLYVRIPILNESILKHFKSFL